jgi:hypothetical protein
MHTRSKFAFLAAVVAIGGISSPVLAASGDWPDGRNDYGMVTRNGWNAYAMMPHEDSNSSAFTGGGSSATTRAKKFIKHAD